MQLQRLKDAGELMEPILARLLHTEVNIDLGVSAGGVNEWFVI